jgi:hypothetical protein
MVYFMIVDDVDEIETEKELKMGNIGARLYKGR